MYAWNGGELGQKVKIRNADLKLTMKKVPPPPL